MGGTDKQQLSKSRSYLGIKSGAELHYKRGVGKTQGDLLRKAGASGRKLLGLHMGGGEKMRRKGGKKTLCL